MNHLSRNDRLARNDIWPAVRPEAFDPETRERSVLDRLIVLCSALLIFASIFLFEWFALVAYDKEIEIRDRRVQEWLQSR